LIHSNSKKKPHFLIKYNSFHKIYTSLLLTGAGIGVKPLVLPVSALVSLVEPTKKTNVY
jgi:hypothetical protein